MSTLAQPAQAPSEIERVKRFDNARNNLRELLEGWNNRLLWRSFVEKYIEGRMTLVLNLGARRETHGRSRALMGSDKKDTVNCSVGVLHLHVANGRYLPEWNQEPMFVGDVHFVNSDKGVIPSVVRLYVGDDESRRESGQVSCISLTAEELLRVHPRESLNGNLVWLSTCPPIAVMTSTHAKSRAVFRLWIASPLTSASSIGIGRGKA